MVETLKFAKKHDSTKDEEYPFGGQDGTTGTLVVCINHIHRLNVSRGFQTKARYVLPGAAMLGHRYDRIIVFTPQFESGRELNRFKDWLDNNVLPKLTPNGELFYV